jgi:hypothetical protein
MEFPQLITIPFCFLDGSGQMLKQQTNVLTIAGRLCGTSMASLTRGVIATSYKKAGSVSRFNIFDTHGSVYRRLLSRNTNKMQLCNRICYSKVLLKGQLVSSGTPFSIRSSKLYLKPLVYMPIRWPAVAKAEWALLAVPTQSWQPEAANTV